MRFENLINKIKCVLFGYGKKRGGVGCGKRELQQPLKTNFAQGRSSRGSDFTASFRRGKRTDSPMRGDMN